MCGIAGVIPAPHTHLRPDLIPTLLRSIGHRGPDDQGYLCLTRDGVQLGREQSGREPVPDALLLHRRLSILDLTESGWQPMGTSDGRYYITFNGEIYNYLELRKELEALGHGFRSRSDTEVLLAAYAEWGARCLTRLVGMFAFAILDTRERKLFLARDCFGIKPLYYTFAGNGFAFASEIKTLLELPGLGRSVNPERLYLYLRHGLTDHGSETLFADVLQIPAAHYMEVALDKPGRARPVRYWEVDAGQTPDLSFDEAAERMRELFVENVRLHLRSDVPVGAALSGGIDSSAIVMAMRHLEGANLDLHTFSYVADDPAVSEERWVDLVGRASGAMVHKIRPGADEIIGDLEHLIYMQEEPFGGTSIYAQYQVFRRAREEGIKVMLDGQGADELLGGYRPYAGARLASLMRRGQWSQAGHFLRRASSWPGMSVPQSLFMAADFLLPPGLQGPARQLIGKDLAPAWMNAGWFVERGVAPQSLNYASGTDVLKQHLHRTLTKTSVPHLLRYEDRNSMAFSIESRVPFLTPEFVNFAHSLPEEYIVAPDGSSKAVFRKAMRGIVPDAVLDRRDKVGFATPERRWLKTTLRPWAEKTLYSDTAAQIPALDLEGVKREWEGASKGHGHSDGHAWRWLNLIHWARQFDVSFD